MTRTDILSVAVLIAYAALASAYDLRFRRIPNMLTLIFFLACVSGWWQGMLHWSWLGVLAGLVLAVVARMASGDFKLVIVLGGLSDPFTIMVGCGVAFLISIVVLSADQLGWCPSRWRVFSWPFGPFIAVPVCAMVLLSG